MFPCIRSFWRFLTNWVIRLAAPSANPSNRTSPTEAKHLKELFGENSPPIVDGGKSKVGLESTVLDLSQEIPTILRPGMVTRAEMESKRTGLLKNELKIGNEAQKLPTGAKHHPGCTVHYAPKNPFITTKIGKINSIRIF